MSFGSLQRLLLKPLVPMIKINGMIDNAQTVLVTKSLERVNTARAKALVVVINSNGGSPTQSDLIIERVKAFCHEHHLKLYTFGENAATSTGYCILASGDKVFVDSTTVVGNVGTSSQWMGVNKFLERYKLRFRTFYSSDDLLSKKVSPYRDEINESEKTLLRDIVNDVDQHLYKLVEKYRGKKLTKEGNKSQQEILQTLWTGTKAQKLGLADHIGTYESVLYREFPGARITNVTVRNQMEQRLETSKTIIKILTSQALPYFIAYWLIKLFIKIYILILILAKSKDEEKPAEETTHKSHH